MRYWNHQNEYFYQYLYRSLGAIQDLQELIVGLELHIGGDQWISLVGVQDA